jgi:hypothetical protein
MVERGYGLDTTTIPRQSRTRYARLQGSTMRLQGTTMQLRGTTTRFRGTTQNSDFL